MNKKNFHHIPVLLAETIDSLQVSPGKRYIDATIGGGGHAEEIRKSGGSVLGIDRDADALAYTQNKLGKEVIVVQDSFANIKKIAREYSFLNVDGILLDIGVSSHQIDIPERGFSYRFDAPLDMRMDIREEKTAKEIVNSYSEDDLTRVFTKYAELDNGSEIARAIVVARKKQPIETTHQLIQVIEDEVGEQSPGTKSQIFQALRIEVNDEIEQLKKILPDALEILKPGGRLCVITFHSLEDRVVKEFGRKKKWERKATVVTKKPITATPDEIRKNKRSKSAKLRVIEKI